MEKKIVGRCYICGEPIVWDENSENCEYDDYLDEEGTVLKIVTCNSCGTRYEYYITDENDPDSEEEYVSCNDQGFGQCVNCGGNIVWSGDFMRSDYFNDPIDEENNIKDDDDAIVRSLTCGHCGCSIEVWEPTPNEMKSGKYPYWKDCFKEETL